MKFPNIAASHMSFNSLPATVLCGYTTSQLLLVQSSLVWDLWNGSETKPESGGGWEGYTGHTALGCMIVRKLQYAFKHRLSYHGGNIASVWSNVSAIKDQSKSIKLSHGFDKPLIIMRPQLGLKIAVSYSIQSSLVWNLWNGSDALRLFGYKMARSVCYVINCHCCQSDV